MTEATSEANRLATVFGGSGFLGRHIVRALARKGWRIRVAVRRPDLAAFLRPLGGVGQIQPVQANLRFPDSIAAALEGASAAVNATGVKAESGAQTYTAVHVEGALALARAAQARGVATYVHVSGIGADANSSSPYIASKGLRRAGDARYVPRRDRHASVGRVRPGGRFLQPLRRAGLPSAGFAPVGAAARLACSRSMSATSGRRPPRRSPAWRKPARFTSSAVRRR